MWIISQDGFISAVFKAGKLQLRARDRESLQLMGFSARRIKTGVGSDYPFRVYTTKRELKRLVCAQIDAIDYPNFKSQIHHTRGKVFENALHDVWSAMLQVEPKNALELLAESSWRRPLPALKRGTRIADWWPDYERSSVNGVLLENRDVPEGFHETDEAGELDDDLPTSIHDMTDAEWTAWLESRPGGV